MSLLQLYYYEIPDIFSGTKKQQESKCKTGYMPQLKIIQLNRSHLVSLQNISRKTFIETFADQNSKEDMQLYLDEKLSLETLDQELQHPDSAFFFVELDKNIVAYMKLNRKTAQTELIDINAYELERIYVLNEFKGRKIGQILLDTAIKIATTNKAPFLWLGVWEKNTSAISFYEKNGFQVFDEHLFLLGSDSQRDLLMKRILTS